MNIASAWNSIASVAYKEFLHVWRDKRILTLILVLPPFFTLLFGHAFEGKALSHAPAILCDRDQSPESIKFCELLGKKSAFAWTRNDAGGGEPDLQATGARAAVIIPQDWGASLRGDSPLRVRLVLDGTDTITAEELEGRMRECLGEYQQDESLRETLVEPLLEKLPDEAFEALKKISDDKRKELKTEFEKLVKPWKLDKTILYNPGLKFIDFVTPGIIGLILQLITVTLMACTIARERESGTLAQLIVTPLRRLEIVIGKVLPYLGISMFLIVVTIGVAHFHFGVQFRQPAMLGVICLLFLLCSLGSGLLISAFCQTQTQAIQFAVFYLLPVFPLSGAFAPLHRLPDTVQVLSYLFPLTHFCEAFRMISLRNAEISAISWNLTFLALGALLTCGGAAWILNRTDA
jgi:ABC-2 type transport system permease protein